MTIDEVIENLKCDIEIDMYIHEIAPQIAEWLEELKEARKGFEENRKAGYKHGFSDGYNKAIDDFEKEAMKQFTDFDLKHGYPTVTDCKIILRDIAEQLKSKTKL